MLTSCLAGATYWQVIGASRVFGDAGLPNIDPKLEQFAVDSARSPQRIGYAHLADQLADLRRNGGTSRPATRLPVP